MSKLISIPHKPVLTSPPHPPPSTHPSLCSSHTSEPNSLSPGVPLTLFFAATLRFVPEHLPSLHLHLSPSSCLSSDTPPGIPSGWIKCYREVLQCPGQCCRFVWYLILPGDSSFLQNGSPALQADSLPSEPQGPFFRTEMPLIHFLIPRIQQSVALRRQICAPRGSNPQEAHA